MLRVMTACCWLQMGLHGAPLIYGLFMRPRSAVIEFRPHQFEGASHAYAVCACTCSRATTARCFTSCTQHWFTTLTCPGYSTTELSNLP